MAAVMIGVDPHKGSHTAVAIDPAEAPLGELRVRACSGQAVRLLEWAAAWPERIWAVEGAGGLGHMLAQQLLTARPAMILPGSCTARGARHRASPADRPWSSPDTRSTRGQQQARPGEGSARIGRRRLRHGVPFAGSGLGLGSRRHRQPLGERGRTRWQSRWPRVGASRCPSGPA
jgi:hypothetical protein